MESLANAVLASIPPNAIDRQRVCEVIARAEDARLRGRNRDAARMLIDVGSALFRLQADQAIAVAEQAFQGAVQYARMIDAETPEYMKEATEGSNSELGDAYTLLGNCERMLGKMQDAEGHYKAAAKAVEDDGLEAYANKFVHRVMISRLKKEFDRHEQLCDAWEESIRKAAKDGVESDTALLASTGICLQERAGGLADQGKFKEAAELRAGKFLETVVRMQAHGLRTKPDVLLPNVYDSIAALYLKANDRTKALAFLSKAVASTACTESFRDKFVPEGESRGIRAASNWADVRWHPSLLVSKKGASEESSSDEDVVPKRPWELTAEEKDIVEQVMRVGDNWQLKRGKKGPPPERGATPLGHIVYTLANHIMQAEKWSDALRPLTTAACLLQNDLDMQGDCFHLLGVANFQLANLPDNRARAREILPRAANAFALAADTRVVDGKTTQKGASEAISSLLFLGRCLFELGEYQQSETVTAQAISLGRQVLGDNAKPTAEAIRAMMELKRQMANR